MTQGSVVSTTTAEQKVTIIEDTYLLAAMVTFDPSIRYFPVLDHGGRVAFEVDGGTGAVLAKLYDGESAPITTYISNLKALRSAIFAMKKTGNADGRRFDQRR
jgi:hypothetical protein